MKENIDNVLVNEESRKRIVAGANKVVEAVKMTIGPAGASAILEHRLNPGYRIVDDGVSVAKAIILGDPYENIGARIIQEIAGQADKDSGDGTTTATVIAGSIINQGRDANPQQLKRSLDECLPIIYNALDLQKKDITVEQVGKIALTSSGNEELSNVLQNIYKDVGKEGIVEIDNSNLPETFYELVEGMRFRGAGYLGAYSTTEPGKAVYLNPKILVCKEKITSVNQIEPIVNSLAQKGVHELVIYCDEIDVAVASRLALTHLQGGFKTLIINSPTLFKDWLFEDMCVVTGATAVSNTEGKTFKTLSMNDLGTCDKIITTRDETRVIGLRDIQGHIASLKNMSKDDENLNMRLSWLQTKAAILKIGANSEAELSGKRAKAIDAISACHHALAGGVVNGAGEALANTVKSLPNTIGGNILANALLEPMNQIASNAGYKPSFGLDSSTGLTVDMWEAGILDPIAVVKNSVKAAISVASTLLSTKIITTIPTHEAINTMPQLPQA